MILDEIISKKMKRVEKRKEEISLEDIKDRAYAIANKEKMKETETFFNTLNNRSFSIIGEFKKASPSKGVISENFSVSKIAEVYKTIGIPAFSILTEEDYFLGNDEYIKQAMEIDDKPVLRKDFVTDIYQIYETKVLGAKAVLLIVAVLKDRLKDFYNESLKISLTPLVEVHNDEELEIALSLGCNVIGINNRDLKTFKVDLKITEDLIKKIPNEKIILSESGISSVEDMRHLKSLGVNALLIGELFMRNLEKKDFINEVQMLLKE